MRRSNSLISDQKPKLNILHVTHSPVYDPLRNTESQARRKSFRVARTPPPRLAKATSVMVGDGFFNAPATAAALFSELSIRKMNLSWS